jgi:hypothetical protein
MASFSQEKKSSLRKKKADARKNCLSEETLNVGDMTTEFTNNTDY